MPNTQLLCPHCSSTLTFGGEIAAGTSVTCVVCMRAFSAVNPQTIPDPASIQPAKTVPKRPPVGKPASDKRSSTAKAAPVAKPSGKTLSTRWLVAGGAAFLTVAAMSFCCVGVFFFVASRDKDRPDRQVAELPAKKDRVGEKNATTLDK